MNFLADNLRFLRNVKRLSQEKLAKEIFTTRSAYSKYELGSSDPSPETLLRISHFYHVAIELLISYDLRKVDLDGLLKLQENKIYVPMLVNSAGENFIEIIPHTAKAGYLTGYSDPEFIENLNRISLPFLRDGRFRAFPIEGDSMPPFNDGSFIVGRYVENAKQVRNGRSYIVVTENEGIIYKRVTRKQNLLTMISDNTIYAPYEIHLSSVLEIWEFACSISVKEFERPEPESIHQMFSEIKSGIGKLSQKLAITH